MSDKDLKQAFKKQNKKIRAHKTKDKARQFGWKALDMALTAPLHLIDQASVLDLHAKDFVNYVKTGKTRDQRNRPRLMDPSNTDFDKREKRQEYLKSKLKREYGRTGFRPYLSGTDWHHFLYGNPMEQRSNRLSWYGKFNPFSRLSEKRNKKYKNIQTGWVSPRAGLRDEKKQYRDELARRRQGVVAPNDIVC